MKRLLTVIVCVELVFSFVLVSPVYGYYTNMSASVVVGQPDFSSNSANQGGTTGANTLNRPTGVFISNGKMLVADRINSRILIYNTIPTTNNASADVVVGQSSFIGTSGNQGGSAAANTLRNPWNVISDGTRMYVTDFSNNRVLIWNSIPTTNNVSADIVIGQPTFTATTANNGGRGANTLNGPDGIFVYGGKLFIGDAANNRVLIYNSIPTTNNASADVVIGQQNFTFGSANQGGSPGANTLNGPTGIWVDNEKVFIAEQSNRRVLIFNSIPTTNNASADVVIGQQNFTSNSSNQGNSSPAANTLSLVTGVIVANSRLFISEGSSSNGNNRILIFNSIPTSNNASADIVIGQPDFATAGIRTTDASSLVDARYIFVDGNRLYVPNDSVGSSTAPNRILIFNNIVSTPELTLGGVEKLSDNRLKLSGNVKLGEAGHYDLGGGGGVSFSVNGVDGAGVNTIGNQMNDGAGSLLYDFSNDFEAWVGGNGTKDDWISSFDTLRSSRGFSVKVTSRNSNTDSSRIFYFEPFKITSFSPSVARFSVNKYQVQTIKDNIDHFEIWVRSISNATSTSLIVTPTSSWTKYLDTISTDKIDQTSGEVVVSTTSSTQFPLISLLKGKYEVKAVAVSKDSNFRQDSQNTISVNLTSSVPPVSYINPNNYQATTNQWFPLQLEKALGTNMGIVSSFNLGSVSTFPYISQDLSSRLSGTSFAGSTVAVRVTDTTSGIHKDYTTTTNKDSTFTIFHSLFPTSILTISTFDTNGHFNLLPPITVTTGE